MESFVCVVNGISETIEAEFPAEAAIRAARIIPTREVRIAGQAAVSMLTMVEVRAEDGAMWQFTVAAVALLSAALPAPCRNTPQPDEEPRP